MNQHTKSRMDGGDGLERDVAFETYAEEIKNPCGCTLVRRMDYVQVCQCPMHAMADVTLASLEAAAAWFDKWLERRPPETPIPNWYNDAQTTIQKARGQ